ncbi:YybH family protein [Qipengyuania sp. MTN3-11]|uniref:YybH family protein n=1 Tax=Qipengyuania sp. MTN3-11 TaxID=3056557 RepID=UPI0036F3F2F8
MAGRILLALGLALAVSACDAALEPRQVRMAEETEKADASPEQVRSEVEAALAESVAGWNAGNMDRFIGAYSAAPDITYISGDELVRGRASMAERYATDYDFADAASRGELAIETLDFRPLGPDHALLVGRYTLTWPDREPASGPTSLVFAREDEGWRIVADHSG